MPLALKVEADERSLDDTARQITSAFDGIGSTAATHFLGGLASGLGGGAVGRVFSDMSTAGVGALEGIGATAVTVAASVAGIGLAAAKVGEELYLVGERFDVIGDSMAARTGKIGSDLDALNESLRNVGRNTASSFEDLGDIMSRVSQSMQLTGSSLEDVTKQIADLNRMTGENLDVRDLGMAMRGFGEDATEATGDIDALYQAFTRTGEPINELLSIMVNVGPAARTLGLDFDETANLLTKFDEAGINASRTAMALQHAASVFADANIPLKTGLADTITQIRGLIDAGNDAAALDLAEKVFGTRGAQQFVDAIRQGTIDVDTLKTGLQNTGTSIERMNDATADWAETWQTIKNRVGEVADEIGGPLFNAVNRVLQDIFTQPPNVPELSPDQRITDTYPQTTAPPGTNLPGVGTTPPPLSAPPVIGSIWPDSNQPPAQPTPRQPSRGTPFQEPPITGSIWDIPPGDIPPVQPSPTGPPQDIAGALEDAKKGGTTPGVSLPLGEPPTQDDGETAQHWRAEINVWQTRHDLEEKQATVQQLEQSGNATEEQLVKARNDVIEAKLRVQQAEQALTDADKQKLATPQIPLGAAPGTYPGESDASYNANLRLWTAQNDLAEKQAALTQLEQSGTASRDELVKARNEVTVAETEVTRAERAVNSARENELKRHTTALEDLGVKIDQDFGISQGLPGIAENLTKFLANLAAAPLLGQLSAISAAGGGSQAGSGVLGMLAQQGVFGPQYVPQTPTSQIGPTSQTGLTNPSTLVPRGGIGNVSNSTDIATAGSRVQALYMLAASLEGTPYSQALRNDCSGLVSELVSVAVGLPVPSAGQRFTTVTEGSWLLSHGFTMGEGPPGSLRVGWNPAPGNAGHTAVTLPLGQNAEQGGSNSAFTVGPGAAGANDPQFPLHAYLPMLNVRGYDEGGAAEDGGFLPPWWPHIDPGSLIPDAARNPSYTNLLPMIGGSLMPALAAPLGFLSLGKSAVNLGAMVAYAESGQPYKPVISDEMSADWNWQWAHPWDAPGKTHPWWPTSHYKPTGAAPGQGSWQTGGGVPGYGGGDQIPAMLERGEHVLTKEDVAALGGHAGVYALRAALRLEDGGPIDPQEHLGTGTPPGPNLHVGSGRSPGPDDYFSGLPSMQPSTGSGPGFQGLGGLPMAAISTAASGLDLLAPGAGAAANMGIQVINRTIGYLGQLAGIAVGGWLETLLPAGSPVADPGRSWVGKLAAGFAGARPNLPNVAGQLTAQTPAMTSQTVPTPKVGTVSQGGTAAPKAMVNIENFNAVNGEHSAGNDIARQQYAMYSVGAR